MSSGGTTASTDGLPLPRRRWAVATFSIGLAMGSINSNIANVGLPVIGRDFHIDPATSIWIVNAFQLTAGICILPMSSLADILGYKLVYRFGLALFALASILCAFAPSFDMLIAGRALQGLAFGATSACNGPVIRYTYPREALGRGIAFNSLIFSTSSVIGPSLASAILAVASWHWLFAISIPFAVTAFAMSGRFLAPAEGTHHRWDMPSAFLNAVTVTLMILGIDGLGARSGGGLRPSALVELAGAVIFGTLLVRRQLGLAIPMLAVDLFRRPIFALSALTAMVTWIGQGLTFITLPFLLLTGMGLSQIDAGLMLSAWPAAQGLTAQVAGRLSDHYPVGMLGTIAMLIATAGLLSLAFMPPHPSELDVVWRLALSGMGFGLFASPNNRALLTSAPRERAGGAGAVQQICRQIGIAVGTAMAAVIFSLTAGGRFTLAGAHLAIFLGAGFTLAAAFISSFRLLKVRMAP